MARRRHHDPLTDEQVSNYLATGGLRCPRCNSSEIEGNGNVELDAGIAWQNIVCNTCEFEWADVYQLVSVDPSDDPGEEPWL